MIENPFEVLEGRLIKIEGLLNELNKRLIETLRINEEPDRLMDIKEASSFIRLSVPTIYGLVHQSAIPVSKKSKMLYFSKKELLAWVQAGRRKTMEEIKAEADNYLKRRPWPHNKM